MFSKRRKYDVVTFDCYGTLIDWERGIRNSLVHLFGKNLDVVASDEAKLFKLYEFEEREVEAGLPFRPYHDVMRLTAEHVATKLGKKLQPRMIKKFPEELPKWTPFSDTNASLERIARNHRVGILSNVDDDLLEKTMRHFSVPFDFVVTAQHIQSYKPRPKHFAEAKKIIGPEKRWIHVAGSLYHDILPASVFGIPSVWVNRQHLPMEKQFSEGIISVAGSLTEVAEWLSVS